MAVIREHLARKGLGLHCDLQNEHAIVGNNVGLLLMLHYGSPEQQQDWTDDLAAGKRHFAFGITEPEHGSDATFMETTATKDGADWVITGEKTWNTGIHTASHDLIFARTSGAPGSGTGITGFLVPVGTPGFKVEEYLWTFNMPTDHGRVSLDHVRVPDRAILGAEGRGLLLVQHFFNENRIRQAASSLGAAQFCIDRSVEYAKERKPFGKPLASNQAIQFPLVELQTQAEMLRALIHKTAWSMDTYGPLTQSEAGLHVQLRGQPAVLRRRGPRHAGARRPGLLAAPAVRAHLPAPPALPHHRGRRGDPDAAGGRLPVRLHQARHPQGRHPRARLRPR